MKRVFFLGAGFSNLADFPLGNDLLSFVKQKLASSHELFDQDVYLPILEKVIDVFNASNRSFFAGNLELLLTSLTLSLNYGEKDFIDKLMPIYKEFISHGETGYFFPHHIIGRITYGIRSAFRNHHIRISSYGKNPPIDDVDKAGIYDYFFDMLEEGDVIITLNYDLISEQALWTKDKWTLLDGYGFKKSKESFMDENKIDLHEIPNQSKIKIYKLHGSINWAIDDENNKIILTDLQGFFKDYKGKNTEDNKFHANQASCLILPNYSRSLIGQNAMLEVWRKANKAISECEQLYFVGYGLSDIDSSIHYLLYDSINSNSKLNKKNVFIYTGLIYI